MEPPKKRSRVRAPCFTLEFPGDDAVRVDTRESMKNARQLLMSAWNQPVSNTDILKYLLKKYMDETSNDTVNNIFTTHQKVKREDVDQDIFVTAKSSIQKCLDIADHHARSCADALKVNSISYRGHAIIAKLKCSNSMTHHCAIPEICKSCRDWPRW